ncbi:immune-responsive protein [Aspergillus eucalypticola CBS 122712]|uniref:Immune-responsive protein n=1 Tax=Aspergillus eucalypticola (strain CBS 122712 / IBT 29274) TaxID=1448314 RepID=A0A317VUG4_ASPEC|nr:immune-responsive protein [Aspergillus eucalypticola CBS 122712]PWY76667.1 immune-responsive protein [Aspergillus eucalypticola CBS 122712]
MTSHTPPPATSTGTPVTHTLSNWLEELTSESIPAEVRERAKYLILDGLACALLGARLPWSVKAHDAITAIEGEGKCTVIGWNETLPPNAAALLNSTFIQGFDLDDIHIEAPLHNMSVIVPAILAAAEQEQGSSTRPISGKDFLTATVAGCETGPRVGYALGGTHMLTIGWHSGAIFGPAASAAAVSKLLNLPAAQIEDALGMACTQACGLMSAQFESMVKRMQHGFASRSGVLATYLAKQGFTGIKEIFDREYGGFLKMFSLGAETEPKFHPEEICKGLGEVWQIKKIKQKLHALCAVTHCTVDCVKDLQAEHPAKMGEWKKIVKIEAEMARAAMKKGGWAPEKPATVTAAQMSIPYAVALQVLDGEIVPGQFAPSMLNREELWDVIGLVECREAKELDNTWAQRVKITFEDGEVLEKLLKAPKGVHPGVTNEEVLEKWRAVTKGVIPEERQKKIEEVVLNLEDVEDVAGVLGELLRGETVNVLQ